MEAHLWPVVQEGMVGFSVDNQPAPWDTVQVIYNSTRRSEDLRLPAGKWEILADGKDSFRWIHPETAEGEIEVEPVSILVLGRREQEK